MWDLPRPGLEPLSLHWQADSRPLRHQGSPMKFLYYLTIHSTTQWTGLFPTTPQRRDCPLFDVTWESNLTFKVTEVKFTQFYELKWHHSEFVLYVAELKYSKILKWVRLIFSCLLSLHWEPLSPFLVAVLRLKGHCISWWSRYLSASQIPIFYFCFAEKSSLLLENSLRKIIKGNLTLK